MIVGSDNNAAGRGQREFCEEAIAVGRAARDVRNDLRKKFDMTELASKAMVLSSVEFNARFCDDLLERLSGTSPTDQQKCKRLMRKFGLEEDDALFVIQSFKNGERASLKHVTSFGQLAEKVLTDAAQEELRTEGCLR